MAFKMKKTSALKLINIKIGGGGTKIGGGTKVKGDKIKGKGGIFSMFKSKK